MRKQIETLLAAAALTALLSGCEGGDESSDSPKEPAALDSPAAGAAFLATANSFIEMGDSLAFAKSAGDRPRHLSFRTKAAETSSCEGGGTQSFDEETGRSEYDQCTHIFEFDDYSATETIHGVETEECAASVGGGSRYTNDCQGEFLDSYGESGTAITYDIRDNEGGNVLFSDLYTDRYSEYTLGNDEGFGYSSEYNGRISALHRNRSSQPAVLTFTGFQIVENYFDDGQEEYELNGTLRSEFSTAFGSCVSGTATYETTVPIRLSSNGTLSSGEFSLTNQDGDTANIVVDDGRFVVTVDGASESYRVSDLENICG